MADSAHESTAVDESRELPPIRIHHFLAWTAVMAVMLAAQRAWQFGGAAGMPSALQTKIIAMGTVGSVLSSLAVTIVLFGVYWRRIGLPFFTEPGQWLLVVLCGANTAFAGNEWYYPVCLDDHCRGQNGPRSITGWCSFRDNRSGIARLRHRAQRIYRAEQDFITGVAARLLYEGGRLIYPALRRASRRGFLRTGGAVE